MDIWPDAVDAGSPPIRDPHPGRSAAIVLLSGVLFGTAGTARAVAAPAASNVSVGALRALVGGLSLLAAIPRLGGSRSRTISLWRRPPVLLMAVATAVYQVSFFAAVGSAGVAVGTLVAVGSAPIFAGLLAWPVLAHRPTGAWVAATGIAVSGLVLLSSDALAGSGGGIGVLLALAAGLANGSYNVATKPVLDTGVEPVELTAASFTLAGLLLLPALATQPLGWLPSATGVGLALYLGIVTAAVANTWLAQGVHALGPGPASTLMLADPVTAAILGIVVLQEPITPAVAAGIGLVLAGLAFQTAAVRRDGPEPGLESANAPAGR